MPWTRTRARHNRAEIVLNQKTDRKSTRLNSSHSQISYAVFCLKKKNISEVHRSNARALFAAEVPHRTTKMTRMQIFTVALAAVFAPPPLSQSEGTPRIDQRHAN